MGHPLFGLAEVLSKYQTFVTGQKPPRVGPNANYSVSTVNFSKISAHDSTTSPNFAQLNAGVSVSGSLHSPRASFVDAHGANTSIWQLRQYQQIDNFEISHPFFPSKGTFHVILCQNPLNHTAQTTITLVVVTRALASATKLSFPTQRVTMFIGLTHN